MARNNSRPITIVYLYTIANHERTIYDASSSSSTIDNT